MPNGPQNYRTERSQINTEWTQNNTERTQNNTERTKTEPKTPRLILVTTEMGRSTDLCEASRQ